jgi:hypothetical protein
VLHLPRRRPAASSEKQPSRPRVFLSLAGLSELAETPTHPIAPAKSRVIAEERSAERPSDRFSESAGAPVPRAIAISTNVTALVGDTCAIILLSQIIYWSRRGVDVASRDGWIFKTARDWEVETGLSRKMQRRARDILVEGGWIEERLQSMPARLEFRLRLTALLPSLAQRSEIEIPIPSWSWVCDQEDPGFQRILGRSFLFHAGFSAHMPIAAAMMASRLLSASGAGRRGEVVHRAPKYVQLHRDGWCLETGLSRDQWQSARKVLRELALLIERRRNFPRRIDLAIDAPAAVALLNSKAPAEAYRRNRAKQEGGNGSDQNLPPVLPNSAFRMFPNLPSRGSQTHLYSSLQGLLPLQPLHAVASTGLSWSIRYAPVVGWDQGSLGQKQRDVPADEQRSIVGALVWPKLLDGEADRASCSVHLDGLRADVQQQVLDEVDFINAAKPVVNPVGLVRTLCSKARNGQFVAEGAHRIASGRRIRAQAEARMDAVKQGAPRPVSSTPPAPVDVSMEIDKLREIKASIRARGGK